MKDKIKQFVEKMKGPEVQFGDIRLTLNDSETIFFEKGILKGLSNSSDSLAIGIRVLVDGTWGFAATGKLTDKALEKTMKKAVANAKHGARFKHDPINYKPIKPTRDEYHFVPKEDPFKMATGEKIDFLQNIAQKINRDK